MKYKLMFAVSFFLVLTSCSKTIDKKSTILLDSKYNNWLNTTYGYSVWKPKEKDIDVVDVVLQKAIDNNEFKFIKEHVLENIHKNLYKQYVPYIDNNGSRIILLNTFCLPPEEHFEEINGKHESKLMDWKKEFYKVDDGGPCYWRININIDKEEYFNLGINGPYKLN
ncbi:hypothetical protein [Aureibaculum luteum]|uniref:hypothetical protein n=1 Tax=Aureibaculum luteum TaxID=1548456 RepID=UPI0013001C44|nr:hypothetical protein [Aureibaculum luteum]